MENSEQRTRQIAETNDQARQALTRDRLMVTIGVQHLSNSTQANIMTAIAQYDDFKETNDPYGEHDFGSLEVDGEQIFWKFDYFDERFEYHTPDLLNRNVTRRVLTVMLADEY